MEQTIKITADELLAILRSLGARAVVTKNTKPGLEGNYRRRARRASTEMLDGYWRGKPAHVTSGVDFAIYFVEYSKSIWIGDYLGVRRERDHRFSLIVGDAQCFNIDDLNFDDVHQEKLKDIFKQSGPVNYSYFDREEVFGNVAAVYGYRYADGPVYKAAQVKQRLQQNSFRRAVFNHHQPRCVITGCDVNELLEAAHLKGRIWQDGHNGPLDGIPLRIDLHRAYDADLIDLDTKHRLIKIKDDRLRDLYEQYLPDDPTPTA